MPCVHGFVRGEQGRDTEQYPVRHRLVKAIFHLIGYSHGGSTLFSDVWKDDPGGGGSARAHAFFLKKCCANIEK